MSAESIAVPFVRSNLNTVYREFNVGDFCEALSLSTNHMVNSVAWWTHVDPDEAYAVRTSGTMPAYSPLFHTQNTAVEFNGTDIRKAMSLYSARRNLTPKVARKLRVPIDRWMRSKMDADPVDAFINLGTALESLFLEDTSNTGELRFRMALRAAWHLGNDRSERSSLFEKFKEIYDRRSKAVHTGSLSQNERAPEFMAYAQERCLESIVKVIQEQQFPNWGQLIMGE